MIFFLIIRYTFVGLGSSQKMAGFKPQLYLTQDEDASMLYRQVASRALGLAWNNL